MNTENLQKLRDKLEQNDWENPLSKEQGSVSILAGTGIGLINVNKRIKLKYGPGFGIKVDSIQEQGTTVYIHLPGVGPGEER